MEHLIRSTQYFTSTGARSNCVTLARHHHQAPVTMKYSIAVRETLRRRLRSINFGRLGAGGVLPVMNGRGTPLKPQSVRTLKTSITTNNWMSATFKFPSVLSLLVDGFETLAYNGTALVLTAFETSINGIHGTVDSLVSKTVPYMGTWGILTQGVWDYVRALCTWWNTIYIAILFSAMFAIFGSKRLVRWPLFAICCIVLIYDFFVYFSIRLAIETLETAIRVLSPSECSNAAHRKKHAETHEEWIECAEEIDAMQGRTPARMDGYNWSFLSRTANELETAIAVQNYDGMFLALQACTRNNVGGIMNEELFSRTHSAEPPDEINRFVRAIVEATKVLSSALAPPLDEREDDIFVERRSRVVKVFKLALSQYGETALCLSGGAAFCFYSYGIARALLDFNMLPSVISGSSGGAVCAALICTHTDEELNKILTKEGMHKICQPFDESWSTMLKRYWKDGSLLDPERMMGMLREQHTRGNMTFAEAYARTGRSLNISVTASGRGGEDPLLLNRVNTPNVVIASAVLASCALPLLLKPCTLLSKDPITKKITVSNDSEKYVDGSFEQDLPIQALRSGFNAKWFVVSQTEPHIVPFIFSPTGECGVPVRWRNYSGGYRGGFFLSTAEIFMKNHILFMYKFMKDLAIIPYFFGEDFNSLMVQETGGNITLYPRLYLSSYLKLFKNPTLKECEQYLLEGKHLVWQKFPMIRNRFAVHSAVKSCIQHLAGIQHFTQIQRPRRPISLSPSSGYAPEDNETMAAKVTFKVGSSARHLKCEGAKTPNVTASRRRRRSARRKKV